MQHTETTLNSDVKTETGDLNAVFGIPESFRKMLCIGLLAGTAFFAGCAKSLEERSATIDNLPSPPVSALVENPKWFDGTQITVQGTPKFVSDVSFSETDSTPVPLGGSITVVPTTVTHTLLVYQLHENDGSPTGIYLNADKELPESNLKISAKVMHQQGKAVLQVSDFVPAQQPPEAQ